MADKITSVGKTKSKKRRWNKFETKKKGKWETKNATNEQIREYKRHGSEFINIYVYSWRCYNTYNCAY